MRKLLLVLLLALGSVAAAQSPPPPVAPLRPFVVKSPHGDRGDDYHWLRDDDPKAKRPEVLQYLEAENAYTDAVLAPLAGLRQRLVAEMRSRVLEDESTPPVYERGFWYWTEFKAGDEYPRLMRQRGTPERADTRAPSELLLDQPARARGQAYFKVASTAVSPDGKTLAWTEDTAGRRMHTLRFRDLVTGKDHAEAIPGVLEELAWANDQRTLFYIRQDPVTLQSGPVYRHVLGSDPKTDVRVYDEADKTLFTELRRSASGRHVLIDVRGTDTTETLAVPADRPTDPARVVLARRSQVRHDADHLGGRWYIRTNEGALNFRLVSAPDRAPALRSRWRTLVPGREQATIERFVLTHHGIAVQERVDADVRVRLLGAAAGRVAALAAPAGSTVTLGEHRDPTAAHLRFDVTSMVRPTATYDLHLKTSRAVLRKAQVVPGYDATRYATQRLWAPSRDGKRIPVTLSWRRDRARDDGSAPLLVLGYGAYGLSIDPDFSSNRPSLMDRGFVIAYAHVRGGADLGEGWYAAGRMMNKRNSVNDFVDVTQALLKAGWGAPGKVFAQGGSAGGLLMGAVANQAGALYKGIVLDVPFVDLVTTMLDETIPLTTNEWTQWGDPRQKAAYDYMLSYSPYDNIAAQDYPALLVTTGLWDSQVQYYEPAKYVARLRAKKTDANPLLLAVNMQAGHGGSSGRFEYLAEVARMYAFVIDLAGAPAALPAAP
ncbi:MAG: oligopeptidase B [Leptothrix sp. (in: Bacteria)]|nr:oligopeptidase B [Leptothrix sp. (in: b-proteobacteria)]